MKLVTGREFKFASLGFPPAFDSGERMHEYGALIKTVFEISTPYISIPDPLPYFSIIPFPFVFTYYGPAPGASELTTTPPSLFWSGGTLKFSYLGISIYPQASGDVSTRPTRTGFSVCQWLASVGFPPATDILYFATSSINLIALDPLGTGGSHALNGIVAEETTVPTPYLTFTFPPVDIAQGISMLDLIGPPSLLTLATWDGLPTMNLYLLSNGVGSITAGRWRFVILWSEMLR